VPLGRTPVLRSRKASVVSGIEGASTTNLEPYLARSPSCASGRRVGSPYGRHSTSMAREWRRSASHTSLGSNRTYDQQTSLKRCDPSYCRHDFRVSTSRILTSTRARIFRQEWSEPKRLPNNLGRRSRPKKQRLHHCFQRWSVLM